MEPPALLDVTETRVIELEQTEHWLTIWFNQPEIRNPLTDDMRAELMEVLGKCRDNNRIRGITMRGRGGVFCAGGDLKSFRSLASGEKSRESILSMSTDIGDLLATVNTMPQAVFAVVEGAAMAGGFGLACCADVVICQRSAKFAMTETAIGLSPAQIAPYAIQKLGYSTARRLMVTAARFSGDEAHDFGFADFVADDAQDLLDHELTLQRSVLQCAPGAVADTKRLLDGLLSQDRRTVIEYAAANFADRVENAEALEGISAFFDKRKPSWVVQ